MGGLDSPLGTELQTLTGGTRLRGRPWTGGSRANIQKEQTGRTRGLHLAHRAFSQWDTTVMFFGAWKRYEGELANSLSPLQEKKKQSDMPFCIILSPHAGRLCRELGILHVMQYTIHRNPFLPICLKECVYPKGHCGASL